MCVCVCVCVCVCGVQDIAKHNNSGIIHEVPLFSACSDHFCRELALQLKPEFFLPGVDIIREGEMGNEMFFQSRESPSQPLGCQRLLPATVYVSDPRLIMDAAQTARPS